MRLRWPKVLMYHAITTLAPDPNMLATTPDRFEAQMSYLKQRKLRGVSMRELHQAMTVNGAKGMIGLTFDDAYKDFLHTAVPILEDFGFTATVFVVVGMLGKENRWKHAYEPRPRMELLGAAELEEVLARGMEVGSHSMTHPELPGLGSQMLEAEVRDSRLRLGELLGEEVEGFCYPYGSLDRKVVTAVRRAGYAYACGWREQPERSAYDLLRLPMSERDNDLRLGIKLNVYPQYAWVARRLNR